MPDVSTPKALTITQRVFAVLQTIDGGAYSGVVRSRSITGTYSNDLSDAARVMYADDGEHIDPPYVSVFVDAYQEPEPRNLCDDTGIVELFIMCYAGTDSDTSLARISASVQLAHEVVLAIRLDEHDGATAGSLKQLGVDPIRYQVQGFSGQADSIAESLFGAAVVVRIPYTLQGGAGL